MFFRLILRQVFKHGGALSLVLLAWILGGFLLFTARNDMLVFFSRLFSSTPDHFEQKPEEAARHYRASRDLLEQEKVRLDLMIKACRTGIPVTRELYRPHWLEQAREWNLGTRDKPVLTTPDSYFAEKQPIVLAALKSALSAMAFSYTIPDEKGQTLYLPARIAELSAAVCQGQLGIFAWGDYAQFQEDRLRAGLEKDMAGLSAAARETLLLERLSQLPEYELALYHYSGRNASRTDCRDLQLDCFTLEEAIRVFNRRLYLTRGERGMAFLNLAFLHGRRFQSRKEKEDLDLALEYYSAARKDPALAGDAATETAFLLFTQRDYRAALEELDSYPGRPDERMTALRKRILSALGAHRSADCLHPLKSRLLPDCPPI